MEPVKTGEVEFGKLFKGREAPERTPLRGHVAPDGTDYLKLPWDGMEVGDCFDVPLKDGKSGSVGTRVWTAATSKGYKITVKKFAECLRVWRIA